MLEHVENLAIAHTQVADTPSPAESGTFLSPEERQLVARARTGEHRALRQIYTTYQAQVRAHLYRLLGADGEIVAEAAVFVHRHLERRRRRLTPDAMDGDPVRRGLLQTDRVEPGGDVRSEVARPGDLVQELRGDGADRHLAAGAVMLADHR